MPVCPTCSSSQTVKNGHIHNGKQRFKCHECGRQFLYASAKESDWPGGTGVDWSIAIRTDFACRNCSCSASFRAMAAFVTLMRNMPRYPEACRWVPKKGEAWAIQCDELWSFVDNKDNKQWVWLALDADTREIVGVYIGARDEAAARGLWDSLPGVYCQCAIAYTDFWAAILGVA